MQDKYMNDFSTILRKYRKEKNKTQLELVSDLSSCKINECQKLDSCTYSRWESGKTTPNLRKAAKILLMLGLSKEAEQVIFKGVKYRSEFENLLGRKYGHIACAGDIFYNTCTRNNIAEYTSKKECPEYFVKSYRHFFSKDNRDGLLEDEFNPKITLYTNKFNVPIGHIVISMATKEQLDKTVYRTNLIKTEDNSSICIIASQYAAQDNLLEKQLKLLQEWLCNNLDILEHVLYICSSNEASKLLEKIGGRVSSFGPQTNANQGLKYSTKNYEWLAYSFQPIDLIVAIITIRAFMFKKATKAHIVNNHH
ncbi:hypothetical protein ACOMICROBIO_NCLOACGD_05360 [Vibrio sp. B1ASS3]|nr:hypothetical protein ACOMICROBIO_NCLOACGD_05360 [Vibrio sp. B1ASS3]CAE6964772.1 hypothetical protein ACOMICROBIO_NCLOACGD_05360 [Vibrio sp. B1ASS3]